MMMTLVSSARRHDLDVGLYVKDVLDQLLAGSTDYDRLLPDKWKQSHPDAVREYRAEERRDKAERKQLEAARRPRLTHRFVLRVKSGAGSWDRGHRPFVCISLRS